MSAETSFQVSPVRALAAFPLFADIDEFELGAISAFMDRRRIRKGETVFSEGDRGEEMFFLISGRIDAYIALEDGARCWSFSVSEGSCFGEMSIIAQKPRSATLVAAEDSDLLSLHVLDFYCILYEHPMLGIKLLDSIGRVQSGWLDKSVRHLNDLLRWGESARRRAVTDDLTGLNNRRFLEDSIKERFSQGAVGLREMSLMMIDMDRVHEINERHGSRAGDLVICALAEIIRFQVRTGDIAARLSGDEFAVLLPDTSVGHAKALAERIREQANHTPVQVPETPDSQAFVPIRIRTSIGIASAPAHADSLESLFDAADNALRKAKDLGRDRV
ncbi:MAG: GGDEF domain-containing protein, partial [Treponema sp.]|nr:GGDEF domain-containing protein [Treponema sp.]